MSRLNFRKFIINAVKGYNELFLGVHRSDTILLRFILNIIFEERVLTPRQKYHASHILRSLISDKIIIIQRGRFKLSNRGEKLLAKYKLDDYIIPKPKIWDGRYRAISFDIAEEKRGIRGRLRDKLRQLGFIRLQQSLWVHPYECQEIITLLKASFDVMNDAIYMTVESIENDSWLKKEFDLV